MGRMGAMEKGDNRCFSTQFGKWGDMAEKCGEKKEDHRIFFKTVLENWVIWGVPNLW